MALWSPLAEVIALVSIIWWVITLLHLVPPQAHRFEPSTTSPELPHLTSASAITERNEIANDKRLDPVYTLINRVLQYDDSRRDFSLELLLPKSDKFSRNHDDLSNTTASSASLPCDLPCFVISNAPEANKKIRIQGGPTINEVTAGIGWYLRHVAHATGMDIWPAMRITNVDTTNEDSWPALLPEGDSDNSIRKRRNIPYSHLMNVCTHSYSLVWYSADDWIQLIDWMALSGINLMLALTGQEWVQYQVFRQLGIADEDIRSWFNGPAFLTWSRGQNEYGSNIGGPLPISWMKDQWQLQHDVILPHLRELDIIGQLPGFQGNVPIQLRDIYPDANMTQQGATGWMDSLDPLFGKVANLWMETMIRDFGTDHWYQLDGYFNGGTAPWRGRQMAEHDDRWYQRGVKAYEGLNATDPDAIWSFQGFAFIGWETPEQAAYLKGFVDSVPSQDHFVIMDMSYDPSKPEWFKWNRSSFFGAPFVWNVLHNFGDTEGIKGDIQKINRIPFDALGLNSTTAKPIGLGSTPEGVRQNPVYYRFLYEQAFQSSPRPNLTPYLILQMHERYGLDPRFQFQKNVANSWALLLESLYSNDRSVQDTTGVAHWSSNRRLSSLFLDDRRTPSNMLCQVVGAWEYLLLAAEQGEQRADGDLPSFHETAAFRYDLVNLGREVLAQMSTPMALNFSDAISELLLDPSQITSVGSDYQQLLLDLDTLVDTDPNFRLDGWLDAARKMGENSTDCQLPPTAWINDEKELRSTNKTICQIFYEWNARCQITTWNPVQQANASKIPSGPIDYAAKHWSGLVREYYAGRISVLQTQALEDAARQQALNQTAVDRLLAQHAYDWTLVKSIQSRLNPIDDPPPVNDYIAISRRMFEKYQHWFAGSCTYVNDSDRDLPPLNSLSFRSRISL